MNSTKRAWVVCLPLLLLAVTGCNQQSGPSPSPNAGGTSGKPKIAFVSNGVASFWTIAKAGVIAAGEKVNAEVSVHMPAEGITDQKRIVEDLLTRGVDGLAISPINPADQTDLLNRAAKVTKVVTHDSDAPESNRLCYIGMDNYKAGRLCGELIKEAMPTGGTLMIFIGRMEQDNAKRRRQGVIDELLNREYNPKSFDPPGNQLKGEKFHILGTLTDQFDRAKGKANVEDTLAKYPDLTGMVGLFAYNPPLMLEALAQANKLGKIKVIAFDEADETLQAIKDGSVHGTVVQNPYMYGFRSVEVLAALSRGDQSVVPKDQFIDIPARQIRKNNVEEFWKDLKEKVGKGG